MLSLAWLTYPMTVVVQSMYTSIGMVSRRGTASLVKVNLAHNLLFSASLLTSPSGGVKRQREDNEHAGPCAKGARRRRSAANST